MDPQQPVVPATVDDGTAPQGNGSCLRIVVAEDEPAIRLVLTNKLRQAGFEVHPASNGNDGLALAQSVRPHLVITDYQMPRMDGLMMARALHNDESTRAIPIVVLSARGHRLGGADVNETNIQHVLMKPFSMREILSIVHEYREQLERDTFGAAA